MDELAYINWATRKANQSSWKIIHKTVYTEAKLQKMGQSMNGLCNFCNTQVETLKPLFYDCTVIQQNWVKFISALKKLYELSWNKKYRY